MPAGWVAGVWLAMASAPAVAGSAVDRAVFLFELQGVPVGTVSLAWNRADGTYRYRSSHFLTRGEERSRRIERAEVQVDGEGRDARGRYPEALWLWRPHRAVGCVEGRDELSGARGALCVERRPSPDTEEGTLAGRRYRARYGRDGLEELTLTEARFRRIPADQRVPFPPDLFGRGVPVQGAGEVLALVPPVFVARAAAGPRGGALSPWSEGEAQELARELSGGAAEEGSCVAQVRRFLRRAGERGKGAEVVYGLVAEPGAARAFPHAWVRVWIAASSQWKELDPTLPLEVEPRTHLALAVAPSLGSSSAGERFLELFSQRRSVQRK